MSDMKTNEVIYCKNCGTSMPADSKFCPLCGTKCHADDVPTAPHEWFGAAGDLSDDHNNTMKAAEKMETMNFEPVSSREYYSQSRESFPVESNVTVEQNTNNKLAPLSPWAYWGLSLLYAVPIVGFVFLIVFSFNDSNINRRNYTRSFWCWLLIGGCVVLTLLLLGAFGGGLYKIFDWLDIF